jgi:large subunit ribosomal protein L17
MRHKFAHRKLNKTSEHRKAMFQNMVNSLIKYEQITTTLPKAKELKPIIDKVITLSKKKSLQSKKNLFSKLQNKTSVDKLFNTLSTRYTKRNGGYCRVLKAGFRYGDDAPMAVIELVDRDINAKKVDIPKKTEAPQKISEKPSPKIKEKKEKKSKKK